MVRSTSRPSRDELYPVTPDRGVRPVWASRTRGRSPLRPGPPPWTRTVPLVPYCVRSSGIIHQKVCSLFSASGRLFRPGNSLVCEIPVTGLGPGLDGRRRSIHSTYIKAETKHHLWLDPSGNARSTHWQTDGAGGCRASLERDTTAPGRMDRSEPRLADRRSKCHDQTHDR